MASLKQNLQRQMQEHEVPTVAKLKRMSEKELNDYVLQFEGHFCRAARRIEKGTSVQTALMREFKSARLIENLKKLVPDVFDELDAYFYEAKSEAEQRLFKNDTALWMKRFDKSWNMAAKVDMSMVSDEELLNEAYQSGLLDAVATQRTSETNSSGA